MQSQLNNTYKFEQVRDEIIAHIASGKLKEGTALPSITAICNRYQLSRVTVGRAYMHLRHQGYAGYKHGKGFYVAKNLKAPMRILLIFTALNDHVKRIYADLDSELQGQSQIDLQKQPADPEQLKLLLQDAKRYYDHSILLSDFEHLPVPGLSEAFTEALNSVRQLVFKYHKLCVIGQVPAVIVDAFPQRVKIDRNKKITASTLYVVFDAGEIAWLLAAIKQTTLVLGTDVGVISLNNSQLEELLDITALAGNIPGPGLLAANNIRGKKQPFTYQFSIIQRSSL